MEKLDKLEKEIRKRIEKCKYMVKSNLKTKDYEYAYGWDMKKEAFEEVLSKIEELK